MTAYPEAPVLLRQFWDTAETPTCKWPIEDVKNLEINNDPFKSLLAKSEQAGSRFLLDIVPQIKRAITRFNGEAILVLTMCPLKNESTGSLEVPSCRTEAWLCALERPGGPAVIHFNLRTDCIRIATHKDGKILREECHPINQTEFHRCIEFLAKEITMARSFGIKYEDLVDKLGDWLNKLDYFHQEGHLGHLGKGGVRATSDFCWTFAQNLAYHNILRTKDSAEVYEHFSRVFHRMPPKYKLRILPLSELDVQKRQPRAIPAKADAAPIDISLLGVTVTPIESVSKGLGEPELNLQNQAPERPVTQEGLVLVDGQPSLPSGVGAHEGFKAHLNGVGGNKPTAREMPSQDSGEKGSGKSGPRVSNRPSGKKRPLQIAFDIQTTSPGQTFLQPSESRYERKRLREELDRKLGI